MTSTVMKPASAGRRGEYAEQTRRAVIDAARKLFSTKGYAQTKVDDIAALARVSPMTIYSTVGGKIGLLRALIELCDAGSRDDVALALEDIRSERDPRVVIAKIAVIVRQVREKFADITYFVHDAAPHDPEVTATLAVQTESYKLWFSEVVKHLRKLRALRSELSDAEATEILWFFFGYWGYYILHEENTWSYERSQEWLTQTATLALLQQGK